MEVQTDEQRFAAGYAAGQKAAANGYPLDGDGPARSSEAYFNGFIEALADARRAQKAGALHDQGPIRAETRAGEVDLHRLQGRSCEAKGPNARAVDGGRGHRRPHRNGSAVRPT